MSTSIWIIDRKQDLAFFIGSALLGYCLVAWAVFLGGLPATFLILFAFAVDGPHVFSTLTRILLDADQRGALRKMWLLGFPACVAGIGALAVIAGNDVAFIVVACLSHYHISKQHMGFVMIYKRKARERDDFKMDKWFAVASLMLPLCYYLSVLITGRWVPLALFLIPGVMLAVWYAWHQSRKPSRNVPKLLLLGAFIPLQWVAWTYAAGDTASIVRLVAAGVAMNVGHSFQYLRLMYFHNHNRYADRPGLLGFLSRKAIYFLAAVVILALPNFLSIQLSTFYLSALVVGMLLFHFIVDSRIWRVRGDQALADALRL